MLTKVPSTARVSDAVWIDLHDPSEEERREVEQATRFTVPSRNAISEIESSSRAFRQGDNLYLSTPLLEQDKGLGGPLATVGFVLSEKQLLTLRFTPVAAFDRALKGCEQTPHMAAADAFVKLLEVVVDHVADALERASAELERVSNSAFRSDRRRGYRMSTASRKLHQALRKLGRMDHGLSHIRDALVGVGRVTAFVLDAEGTKRLKPLAPRLHAIKDDIGSLEDYAEHLSNKIQFLLDATLGFINIQQNDIVKALTIVSVVGVPPVLIAGIYGMNFKHMPELDWPLGYPLALGLIVLSALLPIGWFKWRGWM
jgi:magnesium transporter